MDIRFVSPYNYASAARQAAERVRYEAWRRHTVGFTFVEERALPVAGRDAPLYATHFKRTETPRGFIALTAHWMGAPVPWALAWRHASDQAWHYWTRHAPHARLAALIALEDMERCGGSVLTLDPLT